MTDQREHSIVILGGGLSGLSAGFALRRDCMVFEARRRAGGLCRSVTEDGFVFDYGPHILYPRVERAADVIRELLADNLVSRDREAWIYHRVCDVYTRFPFQHHLHGLPLEVVKQCLLGAVEAYTALSRSGKEKPPPKNYREWIVSLFGSGIANHLMIPYARKLWTVDPEEMSFSWIADRVPVPELEQIIEGALSDVDTRYGFNPQFWYPLEGGIEALPQAFLPRLADRLYLDKRAVGINLKTRRVRFADGSSVGYGTLVYTLPLPELLHLTDNLPTDVVAALKGLRHNSVICVNIGVDREGISNKQWAYFYEDEFPFHRISFPMNLSPRTVPPGTSSISTEIAYAPWRPIDRETIIDQTIEALQHAGILRPTDRILTAHLLDMHYAYVIYDLHREEHLERIYRFLREHQVEPCGRFGRWEYLNMDRSIESGLRTAERLNRGQDRLEATS